MSENYDSCRLPWNSLASFKISLSFSAFTSNCEDHNFTFMYWVCTPSDCCLHDVSHSRPQGMYIKYSKQKIFLISLCTQRRNFFNASHFSWLEWRRASIRTLVVVYMPYLTSLSLFFSLSSYSGMELIIK